MVRTFLAVSFVILTLASCQKGKNDTQAYHISAKINGVIKEFNNEVQAEMRGDNPADGYNLYIFASAGTLVNLLPTFDLDVDDDAPITTKTYISNQNQWEASGSYWLDGQVVYDSDNKDFSITITSLTDTEAKGVFSGEMEDRVTGEIITITEGTFSARLYP